MSVCVINMSYTISSVVLSDESILNTVSVLIVYFLNEHIHVIE